MSKMAGWHRRRYWYVSTRTDGSDKKPNQMERKGDDDQQMLTGDQTAQGEMINDSFIQTF